MTIRQQEIPFTMNNLEQITYVRNYLFKNRKGNS